MIIVLVMVLFIWVVLLTVTILYINRKHKPVTKKIICLEKDVDELKQRVSEVARTNGVEL